MKLCRFEYKNKVAWGVIKEDLVFPFNNLLDLKFSDKILNLNESIKQAEIRFLPPVTPSKIVCIGRNYADHARELGNEIPGEPLLFLKASSAIIIDGEAIIIPAQSNQVEHEGELAIVMGRSCKNLSEADNPLEYILGYICLNDVTARDLQKKDVQFTRAKSFDTFCPVGKFVETELNVADISITTKVNGLVKQTGRTSQMVFPVEYLIRYISNQMTLNAGDVIATGTPSGVSKLKAGDVCEVEIEGIGILQNSVK
ncbi:MAG: fumarylacetoacetate hydrolase family protein [Acidobacteria bacterium]|nr:fumarylacetoacetate hydrolase family protein [Acidobacteriota bacterium]